MILQTLAEYYDILLQSDDKGNIPINAYSRAKVSYALNLSPEGEVIGVIPLFVTELRGKKEVELPQIHIVPEQTVRAVNILPYFLCENSSYILGVDNKGKPERTKKCFEAFCDLHQEILAELDSPEAKAVLNYLSGWQPEKTAEHPIIQPYFEELKACPNIVFKLDGGGFLHQNKQLCHAWESYKDKNASEIKGQCLVTGKMSSIAKLNPVAKGIRGGQAAGCSLVSFNAPSYVSHGKVQGANAPISERAAFAYGTALNCLVNDNKHKMYLGDATVVYWAASGNQIYQDTVAILFDPKEITYEGFEIKYDASAVRLVGSVLNKVAAGEKIEELPDFDSSTRFYILGLSPNNSRLSVRFFIQNSFEQIVSRIAKHYGDLQIEKQFEWEMTFLPLQALLEETVSPKARENTCSPLLAGSVLRAILDNTPYPYMLFSNIMLRIRAGDEINYAKAAIIKAYLIRKNIDTEVLTMSLNIQSDNVAYNLGRFFAILEKLQKDANGSSNIRERYFSSFSANPATVFPLLLKLAQHHIAKHDYGYSYDDKISEILEKIEIDTKPIPKNLCLEEQGVLMLGYYHQRNNLYKKKEAKTEE